MIAEMLSRLRFLLAPKGDAEVDEELQFHFEQQIEANIASGMSREEARRQAVIAFGGLQRTREECWEQRPSHLFETIVQDARYAIRGLRRNLIFTIAIVMTLMLGIGMTAAVFSVVDRILFRSLPYSEADRLVSVGLVAPIIQQEFMLGGSYYVWRDHQTPFQAFTSETGVNPCDLNEENPARLSCASVESTFLPTLGIAPIIGRNFTALEDRPKAPKVALISYRLWQDHFGGEASILDKTIVLDGQRSRIIGVLPKQFEMPTLEPTDVVVPQALDEAEQRKADPGRVMYAFARLRPGVTIQQAKEALRPTFDYSLRLAPPQFRKEIHLQVRSLRDRQVHDLRTTAWILLGVVAAVLLIACGNVMGLLLARGATRERELAIRSALGAGRIRLVRQTLTESLLLSLMAGLMGWVFAQSLLHLFISLSPEGMPFLKSSHIDLRIIVFTFLLCLACSALFGLAPALIKPRLQALTSRTGATSSRALLRQLLVIAQIAASMVLVIGGALLFRSFSNLQSQNLGFTGVSTVVAHISLGISRYATQQQQMAFFKELETRLLYGPGITGVALSDSLPPGGYHHEEIYASMTVEGKPKPTGGTGGLVAWRWVTPDYFHILGIPLVEGQGFHREQLTSSQHFVILSSRLANRMFPGQDPISQHLRLAAGDPDDPSYTVVGVAADVKNNGLSVADEPEYYRLRRDNPSDWGRYSHVIVKGSLPAVDTVNWIRSQVAAQDPTIPVSIETFSERVTQMADQPRFETFLVASFAFTGLLLSLIGLYGVISFLVAQRSQEIGLRMAVGATRNDILRLVLASGLKLIIPGALVGVLLTLGLSRILASLLFNISPYDPVTITSVVLLLVIVAVAATLIPARVAASIDPTAALRLE